MTVSHSFYQSNLDVWYSGHYAFLKLYESEVPIISNQETHVKPKCLPYANIFPWIKILFMNAYCSTY